MKAYGRVDVQLHIFLTLALVGGEWSASRPCRFTARERAPGIHGIGGWVQPRATLGNVEKRKFLTLPGLEFRPLGRTTLSRLLCVYVYIYIYIHIITMALREKRAQLLL
jgi:hypothetical protein